VDPEFASAFKLPKSKGGGFFTIKYLDAGFNKEAEMGEFFIEFFEKVKEHKLAQALERAGAGQVTITTFANNDGNESASNALLRVWAVSNKTGIRYTQGECSEALLRRAKQAAADRVCCRVCKRSIEDLEKDNISTQAIADLKQSKPKYEHLKDTGISMDDFLEESIVKSLLDLTKREQEIIKREMESLDKNKFGFVYGAWNPSFADLIKIGATSKQTPFARLKELSGSNVPLKFELIASVPSMLPFDMEKKIHAFFKEKLVFKDGRATEFFQISREEVSDYFATLHDT
jgi:hypothetical protein